MARAEQDRVPARRAAEGGLRDQRVDDDERRKGERERVDDPEVERERSLPPRLERDADERDVPAYIVFSDVSLRQMARNYPATEREFARISGVGEKKLREFGDVFLDEKIDEFADLFKVHS